MSNKILGLLKQFADSLTTQYNLKKVDSATINIIQTPYIQSTFALYNDSPITLLTDIEHAISEQVASSQKSDPLYIQLLVHGAYHLLTTSDNKIVDVSIINRSIENIYIKLLYISSLSSTSFLSGDDDLPQQQQVSSDDSSSSSDMSILVTLLCQHIKDLIKTKENVNIEKLQQVVLESLQFNLEIANNIPSTSTATTTTTNTTTPSTSSTKQYINHMVACMLGSILLEDSVEKGQQLSGTPFHTALFDTCNKILLSGNSELRHSVITSLLLAIIQSSTSQQHQLVRDTILDLMMTQPEFNIRSDAFKILSKLFKVFFQPSMDLRLNTIFWKHLINGFIDNDGLIRKRSGYILKRIIKLSIEREGLDDHLEWTRYFNWSKSDSKELQKYWDLYFLIYETLGEFTLHLILPVWKEIDALVIESHKGNKKALAFEWLDILFQRTINHENPAVIKAQCIGIMNSPYIACLPQSFIFGTLINAIVTPILYRGITESAIHQAIMNFFTTYFNSLTSTKAKSDFVSTLLTFLAKEERFKEFTLCILDFVHSISSTPGIEFINNSFMDKVNHLFDHCRRLNQTTRFRMLKYIIKIITKLTDKKDMDFINVSKILYQLPVQIHVLPKYANLIKQWLSSFGDQWLMNNIDTHTDQLINSSSYAALTDNGDAYITLKTSFYMMARQSTYLQDSEFQKLIHKKLEPISKQLIQSLSSSLDLPNSISTIILLSSILSFSISFEQKTIITNEFISFKNQFIEYLIKNDILETIENHIVKLELGDSLISLVAFIVDAFNTDKDVAPKIDQYIQVLTARLDSVGRSSRTLKSQIQRINVLQSFYGVFKFRNQVVQKDQLQSLFKSIYSLTCTRPNDIETSNDITSRSWGAVQQYFMKNKWRLVRNILSMLEQVDGIVSIAKDQDEANEIIESLIDAVGGANVYFIKPILNSAHMLLPFVRQEFNKKGDYRVDVLSNLMESAWAAANDTNVTSMTAFVQFAFSPNLLSVEPSSWDDESLNHHTLLKHYYSILLGKSDGAVGLMNLLTMKTTLVWNEMPTIASHYKDEILQSILYGPIRKDDDWEQSDQSFYDPIVTFNSFVFDFSIDSSYENDRDEAKFGVGSIPLKDVFSRAVVGTFLKSMGAKALDSSLSNQSQYKEFINSFILELLEYAFSKEFQRSDRHLINTIPHRRRIRLWQALALLSPYVTPANEQEVTEFAQKLVDVMCLFNLPSTRRYINIFIIRFITRYPQTIQSHFLPLLDEINLRGDIVTSVVITAGTMILYLDDKEQCNKIFKKIMALCCSNHMSVRGASISLVLRLRGSKHLAEKIDAPLMEYLNYFEWYITHNTQTSKSLSRLASALSISTSTTDEAEDLKTACDYKNLYYDIPLIEKLNHNEVCAPGIFEYLVDDVMRKSPLTAQLREYLFEKSKMPEISDAIREALEVDKAEETEEDNKSDVDADDFIESQPTGYQKKILPWADIEEETRHNLMDQRSRQSIIIVATFVDKIPNLAGIARTGEIFNIESLVVSNRRIMKEVMFQQISVSAERWLPIEEVSEENLTDYLMSKKSEGYSLLGIEQTSTSNCITEFQFPNKCVLLLGKEKEGIPTEYINLLDKCIEIPQLGVLRSLNVHVSGSIMIKVER
ncbi:TAR RNA loop binding protein [Cavenderia fasciculata]|uniref:TAR RNA loop binding protein n=1 Tax=Cavenderia fasciculata TaxID=261658 RepID=F4PMH6_CACFS|nr:TAR RNA loop binding protein [Cavenderia fasciculata]EGG23623.1 TAR RNA loop binding protein [Cavenderia fasciculata]|eukprot:XP_004361474.1 TAR RNA loop binding protein [Cavenderia fasciculata]